MPTMPSFLQLLSEQRVELYNQFEIYPCAFKKENNNQTYGFFKPFNTPKEALTHSIYYPITMFIIDVVLMAFYAITAIIHFGLAMSSLLFNDTQEAMIDMQYMTLSLLGIPYMMVHSIVDSLWECLTFFARLYATCTSEVSTHQQSLRHLELDLVDAFSMEDEENEPLLNNRHSI